ncbi:CPBP family intramembrane glutamic endopeptidase [Roseimaritima ulvae]|uniref:CAAX amino terminal protease self-immunity n=1 Tax=Roseimaritima ulvae TaxID=980254 RepID=A0A5B9QT97_9BACT|nr:CPBP family intramembrane glutamic endopeptidase [Roseimaritima ulvae]QEG40306.1 CAAX amino terminal protease self- immunity [Roseimaritima ulvae]
MTDIGVGMIFAFVLSLCAGGLVAWGWTLHRLWHRLPLYVPEARLPANWGFPEVLLCLGVYILLTAMAGVALRQAGFDLGLGESVTEVATVDPGSVSETETETGTEIETGTEDEQEQQGEVESEAEDNDQEGETAAVPDSNPQRMGLLIAVDGVARVLTIVLVLALLFFQDDQIVRRFGWLPRWRDIALGLVASCMLLPLVFGIQAALAQLVPYEHAVLNIIRESPPVWVLCAMAFTSTMVAPLVEEFFFRGVLQGWFQRLAAPSPMPVDTPATPQPDWVESEQIAAWPWWPIFLSSLLFALVHIGQGAAPIALFFLALGLGYLYRITGRLWASITVHFVLNSISTLMTVLSS